MSTKQLIRIASALVIALFLWGLAVILRGGSDDVERDVLAGPLVGEQVDRVVIESPSDTIVVERSGTMWRVNGFDADSARVREFFGAVASAVEGDLVARSPSSHERMGVDDASAKRLRVYQDDQPVVDLLIGNAGRVYRSNYVRVHGRDVVYLLEGELSTAVGRSLRDWRDKQIIDIGASDIEWFTVARGDTAYEIRSADGAWAFANGDPADSAAVERFRERFSPLLAQGSMFATPEEADSADFEDPDRTLVLRAAGGDTLAALLFEEASSGFWVRQAEGETVYQLLQYKVNEITPVEDSFRPKADSTAS